MSISLEETIAKLDEVHKRGLLGIYGIKISRILKLLRELQERRKADNEIPFGDSYSFTELDSIINAYEVHGGYHKKVVELLKELRERRKQPEIIRCKECKHYHTDVWGGELGVGGIYGNIIVAHNACDRWSKGMNCVEPDGYCFLSERRTDDKTNKGSSC